MTSDLSRQQLIRQAIELGIKYEKAYHGCAQCALAAILDVLQIDAPDVFQAATGFSGGIACLGGTCGALSGSILGIGLIVGRTRDNFADPEGIHWVNYRLVKPLYERFLDAYGSVKCRDIQTALMGQAFDFWSPSREEFKRLGGYTICPNLVGQAAGWAVEIILEYQAGERS